VTKTKRRAKTSTFELGHRGSRLKLVARLPSKSARATSASEAAGKLACSFRHPQMGTTIIMAALHSRCGHYIFVLFLLSFFLVFSLLNLSGRRLDVYHTSTHGVALVQI